MPDLGRAFFLVGQMGQHPTLLWAVIRPLSSILQIGAGGQTFIIAPCCAQTSLGVDANARRRIRPISANHITTAIFICRRAAGMGQARAQALSACSLASALYRCFGACRCIGSRRGRSRTTRPAYRTFRPLSGIRKLAGTFSRHRRWRGLKAHQLFFAAVGARTRLEDDRLIRPAAPEHRGLRRCAGGKQP